MSVRTPPWTPPAMNQLTHVGVHWDLVRMPMNLGQRVLRRLGPRTRAVIEDRPEGHLAWLIAVGAANHWTRYEGVQILRAGSRTVVPALLRGRTQAVLWRIPPTARSYLTDAQVLRAAVSAEAGR